MNQPPAYRPDIDGLRAIAVGAVALFHAQIAGFQGGFVGVDVFFVVSGYLITGQLIDAGHDARGGLRGFYLRRAARILPALTLVLLATSALALIVMPPRMLALYGGDLSSTALFWMNMHAWATVSYFGTSAELRPLIHAWSLGVEEQFYLLYPVFAALALRVTGRRGLFWLVLAGGVAALALQEHWVRGLENAGFYFLPARAWELGAGALLAIAGRAPRSARIAAAAALVGLAAIALSVATYGEGVPFPGLSALLPVGGTALLVWAGARANPVSRALAWRPLVGLGLVSYGFYLWHWPLLVLARYATGAALGGLATAACLAIALALAWASWRWVERPVRQMAHGHTGWGRLAAWVLAAVAPLALAGLYLERSGGAPWRVPAAALAIDEQTAPARLLGPPCQPLSDRFDCLWPIATTAPARGTIAVWGDSHAGHFAPAVALAETARGREVRLALSPSCLPLAESPLAAAGISTREGECQRANAAALARIDAIADLSLVVIAGKWSGLLPHATDAQIAAALAATARRFTARGVPVLILDQTPQFASEPYLCAARAARRGEAPSCRMGEDIGPGARARLARLIDEAAARDPLVHAFHPAPLLCRADGRCDTIRGNRLLFEDRHHLSRDGAALFVGPLGAAIDQRLP